MPEYPEYIKWLNSEKDLDSIDSWDDLDRLKVISQRKISNEGQRQIWNKIWGGTGDTETNKPRAKDLVNVWERINQKTTREQESLQQRLITPEVRPAEIPRPVILGKKEEPTRERILTGEEVRTLLQRRQGLLARRSRSTLRRFRR